MFCTLYNWADGGSVDIYLGIASMALVLWGGGAILGNGYEIQGQHYVALLLGSEMSARFHHRNSILGVCSRLFTFTYSEFQFSGRGWFPRRGEYEFVFHFC